MPTDDSTAMSAVREPPALGVDDVRRAAAALAGSVVRTRSHHARTLSDLLGAHVVVKFESEQFTASFKERGARNRLLALDVEARTRGVLAVSAGNHAQAVAHHARLLGIPATIVMPATTPNLKVRNTRVLGAEVVLHGATLSAAASRAEALRAERGLTFVHPYDDPLVIAGQGTATLELLTDHPDLEVLVVPVGGGGMLAGATLVARALHPDLELVGVESVRYPSMLDAVRGLDLPVGGTTIAEGIAVAEPGVLTSRLITAGVDELLTVEETSIETAIDLYLEIEKVVAEGAGAAALAALVEHPGRFRGRRVGVFLSGANIDPGLLAQVILRGLARDHRLTRLAVATDDRPGELGRLATALGALGANIVEVRHGRTFANLTAKQVDVEVVVETMDADHHDRVLAGLAEQGWAARIV
ncbi:MAG: threonine ammonia-lyase [Acidimicrobiales bacterium]|nr:threonine ammonia-lyase [Acidimicrobiales bacterium]